MTKNWIKGFIKKEQILFCAILMKMIVQSISMSVIPDMIGQNICSVVFKIMTYSSYLMVITAIFFDPFFKQNELFVIFSIVILSVVGSLFSGNAIMLTLIYLYGARNINIDKMIKRLGVCYIVLTLLIIFLSQLGIVEDWDFFPNSNRPRWGLGYIWPTATSSAFFMAVLVFCYIKKEQINLFHIIIIELLNNWIFSRTNSRGCFYLTLIMPLFFYLLKFFKKPTKKSIINWLAQWVFPICTITIYLLTIKFNNQGFLKTINSILSNRLYYSQYSLNKYGIHVFGQKIKWIGWGGFGHTVFELTDTYNFVDTAYLKLLLENGILVWLMILLLWTFTSFFAYKHNKKYLLWSLSFLAVYSMSEQVLMNIGANPFVLSLAYPIYETVEKNRKKFFF